LPEPARIFELSRVCRHDLLDQDSAGGAAIVAASFATIITWWSLGLRRLVFSPELAPVHRRIELLEQFDRDNRLLVLDQTLVDRQSARHAVAAGNIR
jgi:hypothetical protein